MTEATLDREIYEYTSDEVRDTLDRNGQTVDDNEWWSAIDINPSVIEIQGDAQVLNLPTKSVRVYYVESGRTGIFQARGQDRLVFVNINDIVHYDTVSSLHTVPDADVYLELAEPYESDSQDIEMYDAWYRDETYPDHFRG